MAQVATNNPTSPLDVLTNPRNDTYDFTSLRYPEDVDHERFNGHYINFYINVNNIAGKYYSDSGYAYQGVNQTLSYKILDPTTDPIFGGGITPGADNVGGFVQEITTDRISQAISLYIPDSIGYSQSIEWENSSVAEFGKTAGRSIAKDGGTKSVSNQIGTGSRKNSMRTTSAMGSLAKALGGTISDFSNPKSTVNEILNVGGMAMNPQKLVLFRGIDFRTFQFEFYFTPRNPKETLSVKEIIRAFRFHSHPEANILWGTFYTAPSTFDIEYIHKGVVNKNIQSAKTCILKNYSVDYAPSGWTTFTDGMPVQTRLILQFQELEVLTKEDIEKGF